jgi:hypothetical protein
VPKSRSCARRQRIMASFVKGVVMAEIHRQLALFGSEPLVRTAGAIPYPRERQRELERIRFASLTMGEISDDDLSFCHSGLCQTALPHKQPDSNDAIWQRQSGRFHLMISPGVIRSVDGKAVRVGVPYGTRARLIMIFLQSEGVKSRIVHLGSSMAAWIRSLGLPVSGGPRGTIQSIRQQALRIARCEFTMQWTASSSDGENQTIIKDQRLVSGMSLWASPDGGTDEKWSATIELAPDFHQHLQEHAVPLVKDAIAYLKDNSLGLDLYTLFAYRLQRLQRPMLMRWTMLRQQTGSDVTRISHLAQRVKAVLPDVLNVYPDAAVEITRYGLKLFPSKPPVAKTMVRGVRLISSG